MKNLFTHFLLLLIAFFALNATVYAQWSTDPNVNNPICTAVNDQFSHSIASDGEGGTIITWEDFRGGNYSIYAQRINADGMLLWATNGIAICTAANDQTVPKIVSDGEGGAIIAWSDFRSSTDADLYAQRINASGTVLWTNNGVAICTATKIQVAVSIITDGEGGAIITWHDSRSGVYDIYAQRVNASGLVMWNADGVAICSAENKQENPAIVTDGAGGAIVTWQDNRNGTNQTSDYDIYAQRINSNGTVLWTANGISICSVTGNQVYPTIFCNITGEAIITWWDVRTGDIDIYAQRINVSGTSLWTTNGAAVCTAPNFQQSPAIESDGEGGAIITWQDYRSGNYDIFTQRINISGAVLWTTDGVAISTMPNAQMSPCITTDGSGGAFIIWDDQRSDNRDVYAQRINANGVVQWTDNGVAVSTAASDQYYPSIVRDNSGGVIIIWWDYRNGYTADIYAQQINANGQLGVITEIEDDLAASRESISLEQNFPNPFTTKTRICWQTPSPVYLELKVYDLYGRQVRTLVQAQMIAGEHHTFFNASGLPAGIYFYQLKVNGMVDTKKMSIIK